MLFLIYVVKKNKNANFLKYSYNTYMSTDSFTFEQIAENNIDAHILYISQSSFDKEWTSSLHTHPCTELFYVTKGRGMFHINNETLDVRSDDLIIVNPLVSHTEIGIPDQPFEYIVMGIEGFTFQDKENSEYIISNYYEYKHEVLFYLKTLLVEARKKEEGYQQVCQCLLEILIINIKRRAQIQMRITASENKNKLCAMIENYIDSHFKEDISLDTLSDLTFVNKYHIVHAFKEYKGIAPISYLQQRRIEEAKSLLRNTDLQISEIADIVGFSSLPYFTQAFKKKTNVSPGRYRKESRMKRHKQTSI